MRFSKMFLSLCVLFSVSSGLQAQEGCYDFGEDGAIRISLPKTSKKSKKDKKSCFEDLSNVLKDKAQKIDELGSKVEEKMTDLIDKRNSEEAKIDFKIGKIDEQVENVSKLIFGDSKTFKEHREAFQELVGDQEIEVESYATTTKELNAMGDTKKCKLSDCPPWLVLKLMMNKPLVNSQQYPKINYKFNKNGKYKGSRYLNTVYIKKINNQNEVIEKVPRRTVEGPDRSYLQYLVYSQKHPSIKDDKALNELNKLIGEYFQDEQVYDSICGKGVGSCKIVENKFKKNPTKENFELLIKTVGVVKLPDGQGGVKAQIITTNNYENFKGDINKHEKKKSKKFKNDVKKAQDALKKYEALISSDLSSGNNSSFRSICGGCSTIEKLYKDLQNDDGKIAESDKELADKLKGLDKEIKCNRIKEVNCKDEVTSIFDRNPFSPVFNNLSKDYTVKHVLLGVVGSLVESFRDAPNIDNTSAKEEAFAIQFGEAMMLEDKEGKSCADCDVIKLRLSQLQHDYELATDKDKKKKLMDTHNRLATLARNLDPEKCFVDPIVPTDTQTPNSCDESIQYLKNNLNNFTSSDVYEKHLNNFNENNCCESTMQALVKSEEENGLFIEDENFNFAKAMQCVRCFESEEVNPKAYEVSAESYTGCDYYAALNNGGKDSEGNQIIDSKDIENIKENEIFTCKDGPKKSQLRTEHEWTMLEYGTEYGYYGSIPNAEKYNLQCIQYPTNDGKVHTQHISCCCKNVNPADPEDEICPKHLYPASHQLYKEIKIAIGTVIGTRKTNLPDVCSNAETRLNSRHEFFKNKRLRYCKDSKNNQIIVLKKSSESGSSSKTEVKVEGRAGRAVPR